MEDQDQENIRRKLVEAINFAPQNAETIKEVYGEVWDTKSLQEDFYVKSFLAPYVVVTRKRDNKEGLLTFQHHPRVYFDFQALGESGKGK